MAPPRRATPGLLLLLLLGAIAAQRPAAACTSYIVGRDASAGGEVIIARNDDGEGAVHPSSLVFHPARAGPASFNANVNRLSIELPGPGFAYTSLPAGPFADAASGRNTSGEAAGANERGVAMSATESIYNSAAALAAGALGGLGQGQTCRLPSASPCVLNPRHPPHTLPHLSADPYNEATGIVEDAIPSVILPQATSARHGAALLGDLVTTRGAGEAFGVLLADTGGEAWYLETASGHHWAAQRVPSDSFFISANQGRFQVLGRSSGTAQHCARCGTGSGCTLETLAECMPVLAPPCPSHASQELDLEDEEGTMTSPGLQQFAVDAGLWDPASGRPFNFFQVGAPVLLVRLFGEGPACARHASRLASMPQLPDHLSPPFSLLLNRPSCATAPMTSITRILASACCNTSSGAPPPPATRPLRPPSCARRRAS